MNARDKFGTRIGFIMVSAGCAIGIGNVWKFPYVAGQNGGAFFVVLYLFFLVALGVPIMTMELAIGRASRKSAVGGYKALEKPGKKWHIHGWVCMIGNWLLMMYYTTVAGWMVGYFWKFLTGTFEGVTVDKSDAVFESMLGSPSELMILMAIVVVAGFLVCSFPVAKSLEKVNTVMMSCLLVLIVILVVNSLMLPGSAKGVEFYLVPNMKSASEAGILNVVAAAMNQAFFTLSIGIASMEIFGSYMSDDHTLTGESIRIVILDTFVAIMAGMIIFPACFSFGVEPGQGPSLIFMTLPKIFLSMGGGRIWGTLFFLFMMFASFSTVTAVFENIVAFNIDNFGWSRKKSVAVNAVLMLILSTPCALGFNVLSGITPIAGMNILGSEDFIVSSVLLPVGSLIFLLFCVTKWGWGFDNYLAEVNKGTGIKMRRGMKYYLRCVVPVLIIAIFVFGMMGIGT